MQNGVPYDVAFALHPDELESYTISIGLLAGGRYNFEEARWLRDGE